MSLALVRPQTEPVPTGRQREVSIDLYGNGQVGKALIDRAGRHGVAIRAVHDSQGLVAGFAVPDTDPVFVDCTSPAYSGARADAWIARLEEVLRGGTPIVTCNKAPLALAWRRLQQAARAGGVPLLSSATVGAGTPVLRTLRTLEANHGVSRIEAVVSGTLSAVVRDVVAGRSLAEAVAGAQRAGLAEPDPTLDLDGTDAYAKGIILHNMVFQGHAPVAFDPGRPRLKLSEAEIREIAAGAAHPEVVVDVRPGQVTVGLRALATAERLTDAPGHVGIRATTYDGHDVVRS